MILAFQIALAAGMLVLALLVFLLIRQIGTLSRRVVEAMGATPVLLKAGDRCPVTEFRELGGRERFSIPLGRGGESYLLFLSFSCPMCQALLKELREVPQRIVERLVLLFLDENPSPRYEGQIAELRGRSLRLAEGAGISGDFQISRAPYVFVVDEEGTVRRTGGVFSVDELKETVGAA